MLRCQVGELRVEVPVQGAELLCTSAQDTPHVLRTQPPTHSSREASKTKVVPLSHQLDCPKTTPH
jgi:hypothetical protein